MRLGPQRTRVVFALCLFSENIRRIEQVISRNVVVDGLRQDQQAVREFAVVENLHGRKNRITLAPVHWGAQKKAYPTVCFRSYPLLCASPVRFLPVQHAANLDNVRPRANEEHAIVTDAKPEFFSSFKRLYITFARLSEAM